MSAKDAGRHWVALETKKCRVGAPGEPEFGARRGIVAFRTRSSLHIHTPQSPVPFLQQAQQGTVMKHEPLNQLAATYRSAALLQGRACLREETR